MIVFSYNWKDTDALFVFLNNKSWIWFVREFNSNNIFRLITSLSL